MNLKKAIITFSFDDGHPNDLKLAKLLKKYSLKATFYVPVQNSENPVMNASQIRKIQSMGFEIGSHGLTHRRLTRITFEEARKEVFESKEMLEKMLGEKVKGYCFAGGKYQKRHLALPTEAGYLFSRTTRLLRQNHPIEGKLMHTTMQYYPLSTFGYLRHITRRPNPSAWKIFLSSLLNCGVNPTPNRLAQYFMNRAVQDKSYFHLHGHSYEFKDEKDWRGIEEIFEYASVQEACEFLSNSEAFQKLTASGSVE